MRRAEKAGRESAEYELRMWADSHYKRDRIDHALTLASPAKTLHHAQGAFFLLSIGAHNLTGRALEAAYAAYDRGYRTRLKEELERLRKGTS